GAVVAADRVAPRARAVDAAAGGHRGGQLRVDADLDHARHAELHAAAQLGPDRAREAHLPALGLGLADLVGDAVGGGGAAAVGAGGLLAEALGPGHADGALAGVGGLLRVGEGAALGVAARVAAGHRHRGLDLGDVDLADVDVLDGVVDAVAEGDGALHAVGAERGDREGADVERQLGRRQPEEQVAVLAVRVGGAARLLADDARRLDARLAAHDVGEVDRLEAERLDRDLVREAAQDDAGRLGAVRGERLQLADDDAGEDLEGDLGRLGLDRGAVGLEVDRGHGAVEGAELVTARRERDVERTELGPDQAVAVLPVGPELHRDRVHRSVLGVVLAVQPDLGVPV